MTHKHTHKHIFGLASSPLFLNSSASSFNRGHISGSINIPFNTTFGPENEVVQCPAAGGLQSYRGRVIVVISHNMKSAAMVRKQSSTYMCAAPQYAQYFYMKKIWINTEA